MRSALSKRFLSYQIFACALLASSCNADSFYKDHARGWHWYETLPTPEEKKEEDLKKIPEDRTRVVVPKTPAGLVKAYREELENRLHRAWIDPTLENIKSYQEMQKDMMDRSQKFSEKWMQSVYQNAELDHTLVSPVNQQARYVHLDLEKERKRKIIQSLAQKNGLFFFFASDCPYCHQFAPIVKSFAKTYGWEVIAISVDGGKLAEFPDAELDNGLFQAWEVNVLPSLYAVNPSTKTVIPVAYGMTALDEMETRIVALAGENS